MPAPKNPWPQGSGRPLPPIHDRKQLEAYLQRLLSDENLASLDKVLHGHPRLVAFVRDLAKKRAEP